MTERDKLIAQAEALEHEAEALEPAPNAMLQALGVMRALRQGAARYRALAAQQPVEEPSDASGGVPAPWKIPALPDEFSGKYGDNEMGRKLAELGSDPKNRDALNKMARYMSDSNPQASAPADINALATEVYNAAMSAPADYPLNEGIPPAHDLDALVARGLAVANTLANEEAELLERFVLAIHDLRAQSAEYEKRGQALEILAARITRLEADNESMRDMFEVGSALMETLKANMPTYSWLQCPSEVVTDLMNEKADLEAANAQLEKKVKSADAGADMYAKAWQRELGRWMGRNHHHIDACVIGTQNLVKAFEDYGNPRCCGQPEYCTNLQCARLLRSRMGLDSAPLAKGAKS